MAVLIRDVYLERLIEAERRRRGDRSLAKTLSNLARERLIEIGATTDGGATNPDGERSRSTTTGALTAASAVA